VAPPPPLSSHRWLSSTRFPFPFFFLLSLSQDGRRHEPPQARSAQPIPPPAGPPLLPPASPPLLPPASPPLSPSSRPRAPLSMSPRIRQMTCLSWRLLQQIARRQIFSLAHRRSFFLCAAGCPASIPRDAHLHPERRRGPRLHPATRSVTWSGASWSTPSGTARLCSPASTAGCFLRSWEVLPWGNGDATMGRSWG
jgi:hypothetical protein